MLVQPDMLALDRLQKRRQEQPDRPGPDDVDHAPRALSGRHLPEVRMAPS